MFGTPVRDRAGGDIENKTARRNDMHEPGCSLISPRDKMAAISKRYVQMHFYEWKALYFDENFIEVYS